LNRQQEIFTEEKREEVVDWILKGEQYYKDNIEFTGDWIYISVYLPE